MIQTDNCRRAGKARLTRSALFGSLLFLALPGVIVGTLESTGERVANVLVDQQQLLTGEGHRSNARDRDESGDQAIFNGALAQILTIGGGESSRPSQNSGGSYFRCCELVGSPGKRSGGEISQMASARQLGASILFLD